MTTSQQFITATTPMGATLVEGGATFRGWAPRAAHVYVARGDNNTYQPVPEDELLRNPATGHWTGFVPGVTDGSIYRYYVIGTDGKAAVIPVGVGPVNPLFLVVDLSVWFSAASRGASKRRRGQGAPLGRPRQRPQVLEAVAGRRMLWEAGIRARCRVLLFGDGVGVVCCSRAGGPGWWTCPRGGGLSVIPSPRRQGAAWCAATGSRWTRSIKRDDHAEPARGS
jgi:hypothetical protein